MEARRIGLMLAHTAILGAGFDPGMSRLITGARARPEPEPVQSQVQIVVISDPVPAATRYSQSREAARRQRQLAKREARLNADA